MRTRIIRIGGHALLANATVGETHDIKVGNERFWEALLHAVGLEREEEEIPLVWVLDKPAFDRFTTPGRMKSESHSQLASGLGARHAVGRRLAQYKLLIEVPPVIAGT